ncbi:alkaline shock response membrane anchor protein AmaP [Streptococcus ferus]|uniref:Membrane protein n=1 Tax=Streptococcus ferus TaxID=1345 RepID=A0A2X3XXN7_9STRE|nr:alkaline shock response membrane anchor protein AmaP [Streptococcus ferus]SQF39182.1 membrane protein [Streptococcus ferus]
MTKLVKVLIALLSLVGMTILALVILVTQNLVRVPAFLNWLDLRLNLFDLNPWTVEWLSNYSFWASVVLFVLLLIILLVVLFYPRRYIEVLLENQKGKLYLKKSAIEGFVKSTVEQSGLMKNSQVVADIYKKKFDVQVKGELRDKTNILLQVNKLKADIQSGLEAFFGLDIPVDFNVYVKDIQPKAVKKKSRVV